MSWRATSTFTILRGVGIDRFGDPADTDQVFRTRVPGSVIEQGPNSSSRPVDGRTDQVRGYRLRMHANVPLHNGDRLRDERSGDTFTVDMITETANPFGHRSVRAILRKVT